MTEISATGNDTGELVEALRSSRLTVTHDGDDYVIGSPAAGVYVSVPEPGAVLIEALNRGEPLERATEAASVVAGEPVDGAAFVLGLAEAGLLAPAATDTGAEGRGRSVGWVYGVSQRTAARLFGRIAWTLYGSAVVLAMLILAGTPAVRPTYSDLWFLDDRALATLALVPLWMLLGALHELWHWLAGRAVGVPALFRLSHRGPYLAFETDLTQIVALPRRQRYGPFLAGMAIDSSVLCVALGVRAVSVSAGPGLPDLADRLLAAVVMVELLGILNQWLLLFLRSDAYAVLANALRCHNLYRATWLTAKRRLLRLTAGEKEELAGIGAHDRAVARWFSLVYLAGLVGVAWTAAVWTVPFLIGLFRWIVLQLTTTSPGDLRFWTSIAMVAYIGLVNGTPLVLAIRERRLRRRGRLL